MTFETFLAQPNKESILLFELSKGATITNQHWVKHSTNVWKMTWSWKSQKESIASAYGLGWWGTGLYGLSATGILPEPPRGSASVISTLFIDDVEWLPASLSTVETTVNKYYWDFTGQVLYVHYPTWIKNTSIVAGIVFGYSSKSGYYNNTFYDGRMISVPSVKNKRDTFFNKISQFEGGKVKFLNNDGDFNTFGEADIYGQRAKLLYGGQGVDYENFLVTFYGYLKVFNYKNDIFEIEIKDDRSGLKRKIPVNNFDATTYPNIKESYVGNPIPLGYGTVNQALAICVNDEEVTPTEYNFVFVDTSLHEIDSITQVYVEGVEVAHTNGSSANGTFDIATSLYEKGNKVTVSFEGYVNDSSVVIRNPMDIIADLLNVYNDNPFTTDDFDTTQWNLISTGLPDTALSIYKSKTLINYILMCTRAFFGTFITNGEGKYSMVKLDLESVPVKTIYNGELLSLPKKVNDDQSYMSSCSVGYNRNWVSGESPKYINTDTEETLIDRYRNYNQEEFDVILTEREDAITYSNTMMELYGGIFPEYTFTTKMQNIDINIEDIVYVEMQTTLGAEIRKVKVEIIEKIVNYDKLIVTLKGRYISDSSI